MNTVRQVLLSSSQPALGVPAETPLPQALKWMEKNHLDAAPVLEEGRLAGLVTSAACALEIGRNPRTAAALNVGQVMDCNPEVISPSQSIEQAAEVMTRSAAYHLPVVDGSELVGMVSIRDVLAALMDDQKDTVQFLEDLMLDYDPV